MILLGFLRQKKDQGQHAFWKPENNMFFKLDVEGMDLQRTTSRELGNSLQVVIFPLF